MSIDVHDQVPRKLRYQLLHPDTEFFPPCEHDPMWRVRLDGGGTEVKAMQLVDLMERLERLDQVDRASLAPPVGARTVRRPPPKSLASGPRGGRAPGCAAPRSLCSRGHSPGDGQGDLGGEGDLPVTMRAPPRGRDRARPSAVLPGPQRRQKARPGHRLNVAVRFGERAARGEFVVHSAPEVRRSAASSLRHAERGPRVADPLGELLLRKPGSFAPGPELAAQIPEGGLNVAGGSHGDWHAGLSSGS